MGRATPKILMGQAQPQKRKKCNSRDYFFLFGSNRIPSGRPTCSLARERALYSKATKANALDRAKKRKWGP
jgi:hypothetical protein